MADRLGGGRVGGLTARSSHRAWRVIDGLLAEVRKCGQGPLGMGVHQVKH